MAKRVNQYQHVFLRRLILPWITVLVLVFLLLFSAIYYQGKQNRIRSLDHQARQSTLALKNHFLAALDQFENIALIVQFGQQTPDISDAGLTKAEQALASYQYMQFLNTVKLGYPVVDSIWTVFDGFALTSNRTRYQINTSSIYAAMNETHGGGWVYPFQPYQLIGEGEDGTVCLTYLARIQNAAKETDSIVAINVNASALCNDLLEKSGLHDLAILDQNNQIVLFSGDVQSLDSTLMDGGLVPLLQDEELPYASVSGRQYSFYGLIDSEIEKNMLNLLYPFLISVISLCAVIGICYSSSKRISSPLCALVDRFHSNASNMDNQTTMIVQKSLESIIKQDYLSRGDSNINSLTQEYRTLMDGIITPQMIESLQLINQYVILALEIDEPLHQEGNAERLMPYFERYVRSCLRNMVKEGEKAYTVYVHDSLVAAVVTLDTSSRFDEIDQMMSSLQQMLKAVSPCSITVSCSSLHSDQAEIRKAMTEAIEAIRWKLMRHPGCHIFYEEKMDTQNRFIFPKTKLLRVLSSLDKEELQTVQHHYHDFLCTVMNGGASVDDLMLAYYQMLGQIVQIQIQRGITSKCIFTETANSPYQYMSSLEFSDHISNWLEQKIALLWEHSQTTTAVGNIYVNSFREYMSKHYMEDLQPENAAAEIGISYSYLRRILSKELNTSFSAYLLTLRLAQTKELLRTTQLTHKEIAEQVGFGSEQTLYRVFRQNEGCSPKEWRRTAMISLSSIETANKKEGD